MNTERDLHELLDSYVRGKLNAAEAAALEERIKLDDELRHQVTQHAELLHALKKFDERSRLLSILAETQREVMETEADETPEVVTVNGWKRYWPMTAVAATVALISVAGTLSITRSLKTEQTAIYKELRRNVEQIKRSQKTILEDIAVTREKEKPFPGKYTGSGFLISPNGYVVTSYHVVRGSDSVYLENEKAGRLKAVIVHSDPENDISILRIEQSKTAFKAPLPFALSKNEASLAEEVYTLGYPREDVVFGDGSISALSGYNQNPNAYQVSIPVNPGNSGGPLLNNKGDLIGIISGIETQTSGAAFAIKSTVLLDVIANVPSDTLSLPLVLPKQNVLRNNTRVQQVRQWKDFVFMVRVYEN